MGNNPQLDIINIDQALEDIQTVKKAVIDLAALIEKFPQLENILKNAKPGPETRKALDELLKTQKQLIDSVKAASAVNREALAATKNISAEDLKAAKAKKELALAQKAEAQASKETAQAQLAEAKATTENAKSKQLEEKYIASLNKEKEKLERATISEIKQLEKAQSAYAQLNHKYIIAANSAKILAAEKGLDNEETKEAIAVAQQYHAKLQQIDSAVGQHHRNIGNYSSAVHSLNQIVREAPAFINSMQTGMMALSNNIPMFRDEFVRLRTELGSNSKAMGVMMRGLFSWNTALTVGVTLVTAYAGEIADLAKSLFKGEDNTKAMQRVQAELSESIKRSREEIDALVASIENANKLGGLNLGIKNANIPRLDGLKNDLQDLYAQSIANMGLVKDLNIAYDEIAKKNNQAHGNFMMKASAKATNALADGTIEYIQSTLSETDQLLYKGIKDTEEAMMEVDNKMKGQKENQVYIHRQIEMKKVDITKEAGEQARKYTLEFERMKAEATEAYNQRILNSEYSTLQQRLSAIEAISEAKKKALAAEKNDVLNDPTSSPQERAIALEKARRASFEAEQQARVDQAKEKEAFMLRDLQAQRDMIAERQQMEEEAQREILENIVFSLNQRTEALQKASDAERKILDEDYRLKLKQAGLSDADITALEKDRNYKVRIKKVTDQELQALQLSHENALLAIVRDSQKSMHDILMEELDKQKALREQSFKEIEEQYSSINMLAQAGYAQDLIDLNNLLLNKSISQEKYEKRRLALENKSRRDSLTNSISMLEQEAKLFDGAERDAYGKEAKLSNLKAELSMATDDNLKRDLALKIEYAQKEYDIAKDLFDKKKGLEANLLEAKKGLSELDLKKDQETNRLKLDNIARYVDAAVQTFSALLDLSSIGAERDKQALEEKEKAASLYYEQELERINNASISEQEKEQKKALLDKEKAAREKQFEMERRKLDRQRAVFERASNIANIIAATSIAVMKAFPNLALQILAGATGAAQLVKIVGTPLPGFWRGTKSAPGGLVRVGEKGKELVKEPSGKQWLTPSTETVMNVPKGAEIIPADETMRLLQTMMVQNPLAAPSKDSTAREIKMLRDEQGQYFIWLAKQIKETYAANGKRPINISISDYKNSDYIRWAVYE